MGYGQVIGHDAMELGIRRTRETGVCIVSLRNSHHIGRIGHWGEQCAAAGFVSTHYVNVVGRPPLWRPMAAATPASPPIPRSEARRVGKECVIPCSSRWSTYT